MVNGYDDKTFKGDKTTSRYEFAFSVAKTMDKFEAADEGNKQLYIVYLSTRVKTPASTGGVNSGGVDSPPESPMFQLC
ncbi:hypothetical protein [Sporomusa silvacetica]|uniref:hypothetical protein n=1 Tax=Sporomusa silvacetica TaxID=55504 RepID=UPI0035A09459